MGAVLRATLFVLCAIGCASHSTNDAGSGGSAKDAGVDGAGAMSGSGGAAACEPPCTAPNTICNTDIAACTCAPSYGDCNPSPGCETDLENNSTHCGACDTSCSSNHANPLCSSSTCVGECYAGYIDCDGKQLNGCEDLTTDLNHCGACGAKCSDQHIVDPTCTNGVCDGACAPGYGDCNDDKQTDGCETDLTTPANCGICGTDCATQMQGHSCVNGACGCISAADCDSNCTCPASYCTCE